LVDMAEPAAPDGDRAERARSGRGSLAHLAKGRSLVDELIAERRAEAKAETDRLSADGRLAGLAHRLRVHHR